MTKVTMPREFHTTLVGGLATIKVQIDKLLKGIDENDLVPEVATTLTYIQQLEYVVKSARKNFVRIYTLRTAQNIVGELGYVLRKRLGEYQLKPRDVSWDSDKVYYTNALDDAVNTARVQHADKAMHSISVEASKRALPSYKLLVKGTALEVERELLKRGFHRSDWLEAPALVEGGGSHVLCTVTVKRECEAGILRWFIDEKPQETPFPVGTLLHYTKQELVK